MTVSIKSQFCTLAMLDVMGFKNKLDGDKRREEFAQFLKVVEQLKSTFDPSTDGGVRNLLKRPDEHVVLFSDTLWYWQEHAPDLTVADTVVSAAAFATHTICAGLENRFLLRGAIACGELLSCDNPLALAGPVVNECARHYEAYGWCGCHLAPTAVTQLRSAPDERKERIAKWFRTYELPASKTLGDDSSDKWAVRWLDRQSEILPNTALFDGELKNRIDLARANEGDAGKVVRDYFGELLQRYGQENAEAAGKVDATMRINGLV